MRAIIGQITLPANISVMKAGLIIIEVRDISIMDAPSTIIAEQRMENIALHPQGRINFQLQASEVEANRSLVVRVHVSMDGSGQVKSGDLLTTVNYPVPTAGSVPFLEVATVRI